MATRPFDIEQFRKEFPGVDAPYAFLDNGATSQMPVPVFEALVQYDRGTRANVKRGAHSLAEQATQRYEDAREAVSEWLGAADSREIVLTAGCTAAINLVAQSYGSLLTPDHELVVSVLEHHSNLVPWQLLAKRGDHRIRALNATPDGRLDPASIEEVITPRCGLVAVTHASNVTGALTDLAPIVARAREVGAVVLVDGAQFAPHDRPDMQRLGVDFYVFSGHKMYGPTGVGVLWGRQDLLARMPPCFGGGEMIRRVGLIESSFAEPPHRFEAGTPPIAAVIGLGAAVRWLGTQDLAGMQAHRRMLTGHLLQALRDRKEIRLLGPEGLEDRLGVVSFVRNGVHAHDICQILDEEGVALRGGHHCAQPLMEHFGVVACSRASLAPYNTMDEIERLVRGLDRIGELFGPAPSADHSRASQESR